MSLTTTEITIPTMSDDRGEGVCQMLRTMFPAFHPPPQEAPEPGVVHSLSQWAFFENAGS